MIWGRADPIAVYGIAQRLSERNPNASLRTLEDVGHYPQMEAPDQVAAAMTIQSDARHGDLRAHIPDSRGGTGHRE